MLVYNRVPASGNGGRNLQNSGSLDSQVSLCVILIGQNGPLWWAARTYLHDELDGADEVAQELENEVLLLLLHLIEAILPAPLGDLLGCETNTSVGLDWKPASENRRRQEGEECNSRMSSGTTRPVPGTAPSSSSSSYIADG